MRFSITIPTFSGPYSLDIFLLIQGIAFLAFWIYGSFFEWVLHRNFMHRRTWLRRAFELHAQKHHRLFGPNETFHAVNEDAKTHICFMPKEYLALMLLQTPVALAVELVSGLPILLGCYLGAIAYTTMFDYIHYCFHVPQDRFVERTRWFQWLKRHHRGHHRRHDRNLNVVVPVADFVFGTLDIEQARD